LRELPLSEWTNIFVTLTLNAGEPRSICGPRLSGAGFVHSEKRKLGGRFSSARTVLRQICVEVNPEKPFGAV
jgi:hypothetical protein